MKPENGMQVIYTLFQCTCIDVKLVFLIIWGNKSFLWAHWYPCFGLLVTSPLGFKARVGMLHVPRDLHLVPQLLTSWWSEWQLSHSLPHTCKQALVGLKTGNYHATANSVRPGRQISTCWVMPARLDVKLYLPNIIILKFNYFSCEGIAITDRNCNYLKVVPKI